VIMVTGCDPTIMVKRAQPSINAMVDWGKESGLEFNTEKTVVVMYTQKKTTIKDYHEKVKVNGQIIEFSSEAKYLGITLDSRLNWNSHLKDKVSKARELLFAVKNSIAKTIGPKPSITRRAYKTLIVPMISYGCHLFADKLTTTTLQNELSRLNRLKCLSLGSVPPGMPTMAMEILLNLKPLDLEMLQIAIKTYARIQNRLPHIWDGRPTGGGVQGGPSQVLEK
jgi:hypothetical protein